MKGICDGCRYTWLRGLPRYKQHNNKKTIRQLKAAAEILNVEYEPCERTFEIEKEHKNDS